MGPWAQETLSPSDVGGSLGRSSFLPSFGSTFLSTSTSLRYCLCPPKQTQKDWGSAEPTHAPVGLTVAQLSSLPPISAPLAPSSASCLFWEHSSPTLPIFHFARQSPARRAPNTAWSPPFSKQRASSTSPPRVIPSHPHGEATLCGVGAFSFCATPASTSGRFASWLGSRQTPTQSSGTLMGLTPRPQ